MCLQQVDNGGQHCSWVQNPSPQGSQCVATTSQPARMTMYSAGQFSLTLTLGVRGIIESLVIQDTGSGQGYFLNAADCVSDGLGAMPWRASPTATAPPTDPKWAPYHFPVTMVPSTSNILWEAAGLPSGIVVRVRCLPPYEQHGPPQINIDQLVDPLSTSQRGTAAGFCISGTIAKSGSWQRTTNLENSGTCVTATAPVMIARVLCSPSTALSGIAACEQTWCSSVRLDVAACLSDIANYGWDKTFCASHTIAGQHAADCTSASGDCVQCVNDIADFGWAEAVSAWGSSTSPATSQCLTLAQLPKTLAACQAGVSVQYLATSGSWVTYVALPSFATLCGGQVTFTAAVDAVMFLHPVRVVQTSLANECAVDLCASVAGFSVQMNLTAPSVCP